MYYSVEKIDGDIVYLEADGLSLCASKDKFRGKVHETDLVLWKDGKFYPAPRQTEKLQRELHEKAQKISK